MTETFSVYPPPEQKKKQKCKPATLSNQRTGPGGERERVNAVQAPPSDDIRVAVLPSLPPFSSTYDRKTGRGGVYTDPSKTSVIGFPCRVTGVGKTIRRTTQKTVRGPTTQRWDTTAGRDRTTWCPWRAL